MFRKYIKSIYNFFHEDQNLKIVKQAATSKPEEKLTQVNKNHATLYQRYSNMKKRLNEITEDPIEQRKSPTSKEIAHDIDELLKEEKRRRENSFYG